MFTWSCSSVSRFRYWTQFSKQNSEHVVAKLKEDGYTVPGFTKDEKLVKFFDNYIPVAATFGGLCIGALSVGADFINAIGSGTGILLAVTIIYQYFEIFVKEQSARGGLSGLFF